MRVKPHNRSWSSWSEMASGISEHISLAKASHLVKPDGNGTGWFPPLLESGALREEWWGRMLPEPPACTWACSAVLCLVVQSCPALCDPITCQAPLSMRILQERILEWIVMPSSRVSSQPRNQTQDGPPNIGNNKTILRLIALYYIGLRGAPIWIN